MSTIAAGKPYRRLSARYMPALALLLFLLAGLWNLGGPPPWWDEGWTLSVARNVVERGGYMRLRDGQPTAHGLEASIPVTEAVAASMRMFGVGLWQGRLPGVLAAALALALVWLLARRLGGAGLAWSTAAALLLLAPHPQLHLLIQGRQVLGEVPMFAALLGGLIAGDLAVRHRLLWLVPAVLLWTLALAMKAQTLPFLMAGLGCGMAAALLLREWRAAAALGLGALSSYLLLNPFYALLNWLARPPLPAQQVEGLIEVLAVVRQPGNRAFALGVLLTFGVPTTLGLLYGLWKLVRDMRSGSLGQELRGALILRAVLLGLAGSWMGWFLLLSAGVPRYMFPPVFLGALFLADLLRDCVGAQGLLGVLRSLTAPLRERRLSWAAGRAWLSLLIVVVALPLSALSLTRYYLLFSDDSAQRAAAFFNTQTPPGTRIETYESELHFFLDRPYHWPFDQIHVELNRRSLLGQNMMVEYDPLVGDPDFLVVGDFARGNQLYDPAIARGSFRPLQRIGGYEIYERVR